ncbi:gp26 family baseplate hub assembly chaperone [Crocinitomicaceae bacterium]|nr:gp26 family baseplate hub assembly chaperone [Crocinitomicaceae bacterium]
MALPKLNDKPKYEVVIPSTQASVRFRPYLVKEEKVLMMAMESKNQKQMLEAVVDTITACIDEPIQKNSLTIFDVEYLFTQIRSKSVGETANVGLKCDKCEHTNEVQVKLDNIKVDMVKTDSVIDLGNDIKLKMQYPKYQNIINTESLQEESSTTQQTFDMIVQCIDSVQTDDENIKISDEAHSDVMAFIESLNTQQFTKIREFIEKMPKLKHNLDYTCEKCSHEHNVVLEGMNDFF